MIIKFSKYQGTGNDFVIIDNRKNIFPKGNSSLIKKMCDRRFGIGGDGLMLLEGIDGYDFSMVYFNSDGNPSSMCGNGGRCLTQFAKEMDIIKTKTHFLAVDGPHEAVVHPNAWISLKMADVIEVEKGVDFYYLNTGSPHYVKFVQDIEKYPVFSEGQKIRYNDRFKEAGTNVNFLEFKNDNLFVRTYERGVEDETLSCGTGVTAAALVASIVKNDNSTHINIKTLGGDLRVKFNRTSTGGFNDVWLEGPATFVFSGEIEI